MYAGDDAVLHIVGGKSREELRAGVIDHMAFTAKGLSDTIATLAAYNIEHVCRQQVGTGFWQLFFHDPNGARVELDFPADEVTAGMTPHARSSGRRRPDARRGMRMGRGAARRAPAAGRPARAHGHAQRGAAARSRLLPRGDRRRSVGRRTLASAVVRPRRAAHEGRAREGPQLIHWVVRTDDTRRRRAQGPGPRHADADDARRVVVAHHRSRRRASSGSRARADGHPVERRTHPTDAMPDAGRRLAVLAGEHPEPDAVRKDIAALGLSQTLKVTYANRRASRR
jgi:hypothetical protein